MVQGMGLGDNTPNKESKTKNKNENKRAKHTSERPAKKVKTERAYTKDARPKAKTETPKNKTKPARHNGQSIKQKPKNKTVKKKRKALLAIPLLIVFAIILFLGLNYQRLTGSTETETEETRLMDEATEEFGVDVTEQTEYFDEVYASESEELALESASNHVIHNPYSLKGLRQQLQQEGFSPNAVEFAVTEIDTAFGVDWNANAVEAAERFVAYSMPEVSEKVLKEQLVYEGFTGDEITHALDNVDKSGFKADDEIPDTFLPGDELEDELESEDEAVSDDDSDSDED